ncbi:MAG: FtsW/RodA/SpoVE family cell cycle protein [Lachnospiraceae bacterium]|nr:FtsW/RodA/SpoVE family cell cycle protein [Lachnospiraceae bacterium]
MGDKRKVKTRRYFDYLLLFILLFLLGFGLVMIFSTSSYVSSVNYDGDGLYFLRKQAIAVVIGLFVMGIVSFIPTELYKKLAPLIYFVSLASLFLVLTGLGHESHGARRWIYIFGLSIQPAEIAKIGAIITSATIIDKMTPQSRKSWGGIIVSLVPAAILSLAIYWLTDNFSSAFIVAGIAFMMIALSEKKNYKPYILFIVFAALGGLVLYLIASEKIHIGFRGERVLAWINPEAYADGKGFQPIQSLYGIGSGGIWGKGLGKSIQKLGFLPEAHNDMIFSIICEELGLFGGLAIIIMFILMLWRIRDISSHITNTYENLLLCGVFTHIAMQVILNIAVVTNTIPNTGISLPFISYGGSSVIFLLAEIGIVMRVGRDCDFKEAPPVKKKRRIKEEETHEED